MNQFSFSSFFLGCLAFLVACFSGFEARGQFRDYGTAAKNEQFTDILAFNGYYYMTGNNFAPGGITNATLTQVAPGTAAAPLVWQWTREYTSPVSGDHLNFSQVAESAGGNLIVVGNSALTDFDRKLVVMELDKDNGDVLQAKYYTLPSNHRLIFNSIVRVPPCPGGCGPGGYVVKSWIDRGGDNCLMMKLDYGLNIVWANEYDAGGDDEPSARLVAEPDGSVYVAGNTNAGPQWNGFLMKVDCNGNVVCSSRYDNTTNETIFYDLIKAQNGQLVASGGVEPNAAQGAREGIVTKFNLHTAAAPCPTPAWTRKYAKSGELVVFFRLAQLQNAAATGNIYASYFTPNTPGGGGFEPRLIKFAFSTGASNQRRDLGGPQGGSGSTLAMAGVGTKLLVGGSRTYAATPPGIGLLDAWVGSLTSALNTCGAPATETTTALTLTPANLPWSVAPIAITPTSFCNGINVAWLTDDPCLYGNFSNKTAPSGNTTSGSAGNMQALPSDFEIALNDHEGMAPVKFSQPAAERGNPEPAPALDFEIYPNPADETVEILLNGSLPEGETRVLVFDTAGKLVLDQPIPDLIEPTTLNIGHLPKGIYSVKIGNAPAQRLTRM